MKIRLSRLLSLPFFVFLAIAVGLWLTSRLSHRYTTQIEVPITIVTDFGSQVWIEDGNRTVRCVATASGRQILSYRMGLAPRLVIPVSLLTLKDNLGHGDPYIYTVGESSLEKAVMQVQNNIAISMITDTMPTIKIAHMISQRVRVVPRSDIVCSKGYMLVGGVALSIDSINVKAPFSVLDTLKMLYTKPIVIGNLHSSQSGSVELDIPSYVVAEELVAMRYHVNAVPYSEKVYTLPIEVVGHPDAQALPSRAVVRLRVPLCDYSKVEAPLLSIDPGVVSASGYYPLRVSELARGAAVVSFTPWMVQYVIEK